MHSFLIILTAQSYATLIPTTIIPIIPVLGRIPKSSFYLFEKISFYRNGLTMNTFIGRIKYSYCILESLMHSSEHLSILCALFVSPCYCIGPNDDITKNSPNILILLLSRANLPPNLPSVGSIRLNGTNGAPAYHLKIFFQALCSLNVHQ